MTDSLKLQVRRARRGVASLAARIIFDRLPGRWEVGRLPENRPSQAFWRRMIGDCSRGESTDLFVKDGDWEGFVQCFDNHAYAAQGAAVQGAADDVPCVY